VLWCLYTTGEAPRKEPPPVDDHILQHFGRNHGRKVHGLLSPSQRSLRARIAAHALHARGGTSTAAATAAFLSRFDRQVDPDGVLPPDERARRAAHARAAYMGKLALKASRARSGRKAAAKEEPTEISRPVGSEGGQRVSADDPRAA